MTGKPINLGMNERVECAETLASGFYNDPAILERENGVHHSHMLLSEFLQ
ncbi:MAG TPA: hypothetical protein VNY24_02065 [Candidatus Acidoferrales bacterium]|jgi:hypothetical protein|nr:hypothetical protein [Candidatus Acidoferrales bacterium]